MVDDKSKIKYFMSNDIVFKMLLMRNEYMLKKIICMSIGIDMEDIKSIEILNPEIMGDNENDKLNRLDILLELNNKEKINIEMQNSNEHNFAQRIEFYLSRVYINSLKKSENYSILNKIYGIYFINYNDENYNDAFSKISECDTMNRKTTKSIKEKIIFNLTKIDEMKKYGFSKEEMDILKFIKSKKESEISDMSLSNKRIEEAMRQLEEINADDELKKAIYYRERYNYDMNTAIYDAVEEKEKELQKKDVKLKNTQKELKSTKKQLSKKDSKLQDTQKELKSTKDTISILIKTLQETGKSIEEISLITNMDISDIKSILNKKS